MHLKSLLIGIIVLIGISSRAQDHGPYAQSEIAGPSQKLYLTTDREFYFNGDTIWFAAFLTDAQTQIPVSEDCNLYFELIDHQGKVVDKDLFAVRAGLCPGYLSLNSGNLSGGNYLVRAYTDVLKSFGEDAFFTKAVRISEVKNSRENSEENDKNSGTPQIAFFPESGFLLEDVVNQVAFKISDEKGKEVMANCTLQDDAGNIVLQFSPQYKGMGKFVFVPEPGKKYTVSLEGNETGFSLPEIRKSGAKLMLAYQSSGQLPLNIVTKGESQTNGYYIAMMNRGELSTLLKVKSKDLNKTIEIENSNLRNGINRLVLLNDEMEPISERLIFRDFDEVVKLDVQLNTAEFETRDAVELEMSMPEKFPKNDLSFLSVSVVDENFLNASGNSQNIRSYLLLDSELKGNIGSSLDYFKDDELISSAEKLDLLMLTNGWRNYIWNTIQEEDTNMELYTAFGVKVYGTVKTTNEKHLLPYAEVNLSLGLEDQTSLHTTYTNAEGEFEFKNLVFEGDVPLVLQSKNQRDKTRTTPVLSEGGFKSPSVSETSLRLLQNFNDLSVETYRTKYLNELSLQEFYPDRNTRLLEDIDVIEQKSAITYFPASGYNYVARVDETNNGYTDILKFLSTKPGIIIRGSTVKILGISQTAAVIQSPAFIRSEPLWLIDGFRASKDEVLTLSMSDVDSVEVLSGTNALFVDGWGGNGIISVYTKKDAEENINTNLAGTIVARIKGFAPYREFYSPQYDASTINSEIPDYRSTLYWNPSVELNSEGKKLTFFTADNLSRYKVFVEGITSTGKVCLGEASFEVNQRKK